MENNDLFKRLVINRLQIPKDIKNIIYKYSFEPHRCTILMEELVNSGIADLALFYKHCLNIASRKLEDTPFHGPLWIGWSGCYIEPYLENGKVVDMEGLRQNLLYILKDYSEYISLFENLHDARAIDRTERLIMKLERLGFEKMVKLMEKYYEIFPDIEDYRDMQVIMENWNPKIRCLGKLVIRKF